jgi:selenocysteine lyase/cysteine desulfurase
MSSVYAGTAESPETRNPLEELAETLALFAPAPGTIYLNTATYGLPPRTTLEAMKSALDAWGTGAANWQVDWDQQGEACRALAARLLHAQTREVALMPAVSVAAALVASSLAPGSEVLLVEGDFTSMTFPFFALAERGVIKTRVVPFDLLAESISSTTSLIAFSSVQSADGRVADLVALRQAADRVGARLFADVSQSLGSRPLDVHAAGLDYVAVAAYKWLCCPRGVAFLWVRPEVWHLPVPISASWRGGDDPYGRYYTPYLALAPDAARFDVSLAWHAWVGARPALEALCALGDQVRFDLGMAAAGAFAEQVGTLPKPASTILALNLRDSDADAAASALVGAGIKSALRAGRLRLSFHFYNTTDQARQAAHVIKPFLAST